MIFKNDNFRVQNKLGRITQDISRLTEKELRKNAEMFVLEAQMRCPDSILRNSIRYEITSKNDGIQISISADQNAKKYLKQAYDELNNKILEDVSNAIKKAIEG